MPPDPFGAIERLQSVVKPGGWIMLAEASMDFPPDIINPEKTPAYLDMMKLVRSIANTTGTPHQLAKDRAEIVASACLAYRALISTCTPFPSRLGPLRIYLFQILDNLLSRSVQRVEVHAIERDGL